MHLNKDKMSLFAKKEAQQAIGLCHEFKVFINRGNVIDLAIGVIIGTAFTTIVTSLVNDIIGPFIALATGQASFSNSFLILRPAENTTRDVHYPTIKAAHDAGAITWNYGRFVEAVFTFFVTAAIVFVIIKCANGFHRKKVAQSTDWSCPKCRELVKKDATRCPHCCAEPIYENGAATH